MPSKPSRGTITCLHIMTPCTKSHTVPALAALVDFWWQGVDRIWCHASCRPSGGSGCTSASCHGLLEPPSGSHALPPTQSQDAGGMARGARCFDRHTITQRLAPRFLRSGTRGRPTGSTSFSARRRPLKGATDICRKCITIIGACPSSDTRCGRCCITSIVTPQTGRRQPCDFSDERFQTL